MTPGFGEALGSASYWAVVGVTLVVVALAVGLHYEVLQQLNRRMPHWKLPRHPRIYVMITRSAPFAYLEMARYWKGGE